MLGEVLLEEGEEHVIEGEDLQSCFNLFHFPPCCEGMVVFEKTVPGLAFGRSNLAPVYVGMRAVPMGWLNSVDLIQFQKDALSSNC